jgi:hypothetical protein
MVDMWTITPGRLRPSVAKKEGIKKQGIVLNNSIGVDHTTAPL